MVNSSSLQTIEMAIMNLPKQEAYQLFLWLQDYLNDEWEQQMKQDIQSGKLSHILDQVRQDIKEKRVKPLDEIFDNA